MATCEFSEFSFGYALTHSLTAGLGSALGKAPIFPSLIQEGSAGGGYDVKLPLVPYPMFLQFKIPIVLKRSSSLKPTSYAIPYYRFYVRTKYPNQHQLLLDLEKTEPLVFYVAPLFHELPALDSHFTAQVIHQHSTFLRPSQIGPLSSSTHHLSYRPRERIYWLRSDPTPVEGKFNFVDMNERIKVRRDASRSAWHLQGRLVETNEATERRREMLLKLRDAFLDLERKFVQIEKRGLGISGPATSVDIYKIDNLEPHEMARRLAYMAQVRFDLILGLGEAADSQQEVAS